MKKHNATFTVTLLFAALLHAVGCKSEPSTTSVAPTVTAASTGQDKHAAPNVTPGSHEDWCEEHQVPESQCTQCNPKLIAAFKATGDWCAEHAIPESQCRACNPELKIQRPPKAEAPK